MHGIDGWGLGVLAADGKGRVKKSGIVVVTPTGKRYARELSQWQYDTDVVLHAAGAAQLLLFSVPQGGLNAAAAAKTERDTSFTQAGMLPNGQLLALAGFNLPTSQVVTGTTVADHILVIEYGGTFEFRHGAQGIRLQIPTHRIPSGSSMQNHTAAAVCTANGLNSIREFYPFSKMDGSPYYVEGGQQVNVRLFWPAAPAPAVNTNVCVVMRGHTFVAL